MKTVAEEYNQAAAAYDQRWDRYLHETVDATIKIAQPHLDELSTRMQRHRKGTVVDLGCGTGALTFQLDQELNGAWNIFGLDLSPEMIKQAKIKQTNKKCHPHNNTNGENHQLSFRQCASEKLPFEDNSVDMITTLSSFHFWSNKHAALAEIYRVLHPEHGVLVLSDWCHDFLSCKLCGLYLRIFGHHCPTEDSKVLSLAEARALFEYHDFDLVTAESYPLRFRFATIGPKWGMMTLVARKCDTTANSQACAGALEE